MRTNLHHLLEEKIPERGGLLALTDKDITYTYAEMWDKVRGVANGLRGLGLQRDDRVAVFLDKRVETVAAIFGTSAAGGVFVPVNPVLRPAQVAYIMADCSVRVLVTSPERLDVMKQELKSCPALEHVILVPTAREAAPAPEDEQYSVRFWTDLVNAGPAALPTGIDLDMAAILYTSGSTGKPKGVVLSHRNLIVGAESVSSYLGNTTDDVILAALPLSFDAGFSQLTTGFAAGAHVVLLNYLLPKDVVRLVRRPPCHGTHLRSSPLDPNRRSGVAGGGSCVDALLRQHRRANAAGNPRKTPGAFPSCSAVSHVRADRGVPIDLPRSRRSGPPSGLDR